MPETLTIRRPDDWHIHLRDGEALDTAVADASRYFGRCIVMPNLVPPVRDRDEAAAYQGRILEALQRQRPGSGFKPLMVLYLTDNTTPELIAEAAASGFVYACKLYPAGATTNSDSGVTDIANISAALEAMQTHDMPLLLHGEVTHGEVDIFDREKQFLDEVLAPTLERFPKLRMVLEHISTADAARFVQQAPDTLAATVTAHHLLFNRNQLLSGGLRPHYFCLPILKRASHQQALLDAVYSGSPKFFLGTDSAPHAIDAKESSCGCAGCYTAHAAIELYAQVFEQLGALDKLEAFASEYGPRFYGLPLNEDRITLEKQPWTVPDSIPFGSQQLRPLLHGETLAWRVRND